MSSCLITHWYCDLELQAVCHSSVWFCGSFILSTVVFILYSATVVCNLFGCLRWLLVCYLTVSIRSISGLFRWIQTLKLDPTHLLSEVNRQAFTVNMEAGLIAHAPRFLCVNHWQGIIIKPKLPACQETRVFIELAELVSASPSNICRCTFQCMQRKAINVQACHLTLCWNDSEMHRETFLKLDPPLCLLTRSPL